MNKNYDYTTCNLLGHDYFLNHYTLIAIDLRKQTELENSDFKQQINVFGKLEEGNRAIMFSMTEKSEETTFNISQNSVSIIWNGIIKDYKFVKWLMKNVNSLQENATDSQTAKSKYNQNNCIKFET